MWLRRVSCAWALVFAGACSFPDYALPAAAAPSCKNGLRDGEEVGVDCGGPSCNACSQCSDGMQNADEAGVDCGGTCAPCPSCTDGAQNGSESDEDCGGTCDLRCETDRRCRSGTDCVSLVCASVCQPSDCNDQVRNGVETGVDCGGSCQGCANGTACQANGDCESMRCQDAVCVSAGCTDDIENGLESDIDCGGSECAPCGADEKCKTGADCDSKICTASKQCAAASCTDATQNQTESDVDCGGSSCAKCSESQACASASDCASALCQSGMCVPESPAGQPLSQATWTIRTSESLTEQAPDRAVDGDVNTCWTSGKKQYAGMYVELDLGEPRYFFKVLLRVTASPFEQDFPASLDVYVSKDGTFGEPVQRVMGNQWTWIDFPSAQVGRYVRLVLAKDAPRDWSIGDIALYN